MTIPNSPPHVAHEMHIEELFSTISGSTASPVTTDEQEAALDELLDQVRKAKKAADDQRAIEKKPHDDAAKAVQALWKPLLDRCEAGSVAIKDALTPYRTAKQRAKDEAARSAREKADAERLAAQAALRAADDLEARFEAEERLKQAGRLEAQANRISREATGLRTHWVAEIVHRMDALMFYLERYPEEFVALIQRLADRDAAGARPPVPGIEFHARKRAA